MRVAAGHEVVERLQTVVGGDVEFVGFDDAGDGAGVEAAVPSPQQPVPALDKLPDLKLVQVVSAGTDWIEDRVPDGVALCNARGTRDGAMAEWIVGAVLGAFTGLLRAAGEARWLDDGNVQELAGKRVVILGMGSIGRAAAARLEAFGMVVDGVGRARLDELSALLPEADVVVQLAPLTDGTRDQVDARFLAAMPDGALFVNAGRGATVDTEALLAELQSGRLRAVLDVVDPEPLPDDHPLWRAPGLLALTSHWAGDSEAADQRALQLVADQLGRLARGEPLVNVVRR